MPCAPRERAFSLSLSFMTYVYRASTVTILHLASPPTISAIISSKIEIKIMCNNYHYHHTFASAAAAFRINLFFFFLPSLPSSPNELVARRVYTRAMQKWRLHRKCVFQRSLRGEGHSYSSSAPRRFTHDTQYTPLRRSINASHHKFQMGGTFTELKLTSDLITAGCFSMKVQRRAGVHSRYVCVCVRARFCINQKQ